MRRLLIFIMAVILGISCASMKMTPEEKKRRERVEVYKLYLTHGIRDKSLTDEEIKKLDALKVEYGAFELVIWK